MKNYESIKNNIYLLSKGKEIFCITLNNNIKINEEIYVRITNTCFGLDYIFCKKLYKMNNSALPFLDCEDYIDYEPNIDFGLSFNNLILHKKNYYLYEYILEEKFKYYEVLLNNIKITNKEELEKFRISNISIIKQLFQEIKYVKANYGEEFIIRLDNLKRETEKIYEE